MERFLITPSHFLKSKKSHNGQGQTESSHMYSFTIRYVNFNQTEGEIIWAVKMETLCKDAGRDWGQEEKRTTDDEMAGWHYRLDAHEFEWTLGVGDGQRGLACCNSWGRKESDTTKWLTELKDSSKDEGIEVTTDSSII